MKLRIYLDTSVISACHDGRHPDRQRETLRFWNLLDQYDTSISTLTVEEIRNTQDANLRMRMTSDIRSFTILPINHEMEQLGRLYVDQGIFRAHSLEDALHVAAAVVSRQDILTSWNFKHLVNRRRRALINQSISPANTPRSRSWRRRSFEGVMISWYSIIPRPRVEQV